MKPWEIFWKLVGYTVVAGLMVFFGFVMLFAHRANENQILAVDLGLAWGMILFGALTFGFGLLSVAGSVMEGRAAAREKALHVTPRGGPPTVPPPWGMGDVGRPGVIRVDRMESLDRGEHGGVRVMNFSISHIDVPLVVGALLVWTVVACVLWTSLAPQH